MVTRSDGGGLRKPDHVHGRHAFVSSAITELTVAVGAPTSHAASGPNCARVKLPAIDRQDGNVKFGGVRFGLIGGVVLVRINNAGIHRAVLAEAGEVQRVRASRPVDHEEAEEDGSVMQHRGKVP